MSDIKLKAPEGANRNRKKVGRGHSSGWGKTSGRGHKGQKARSGGGVSLGFEGGQMPLYRRVAARGFSNMPFKNVAVPVNVDMLDKFFNDGDKVNLETMVAKGLIKKSETNVKILGNGDIKKKLEVELTNVSASAKDKIVKAGGSVVANK
jgi:large subunit ribosomal protein L15